MQCRWGKTILIPLSMLQSSSQGTITTTSLAKRSIGDKYYSALTTVFAQKLLKAANFFTTTDQLGLLYQCSHTSWLPLSAHYILSSVCISLSFRKLPKLSINHVLNFPPNQLNATPIDFDSHHLSTYVADWKGHRKEAWLGEKLGSFLENKKYSRVKSR